MLQAAGFERRQQQRQRGERQHAGAGVGVSERRDSHNRHRGRHGQHLDHAPACGLMQRPHAKREVGRGPAGRQRHEHDETQADEQRRRHDGGDGGQHRDHRLSGLPGEANGFGQRGRRAAAAQIDLHDGRQVGHEEDAQRRDRERQHGMHLEPVAACQHGGATPALRHFAARERAPAVHCTALFANDKVLFLQARHALEYAAHGQTAHVPRLLAMVGMCPR